MHPLFEHYKSEFIQLWTIIRYQWAGGTLHCKQPYGPHAVLNKQEKLRWETPTVWRNKNDLPSSCFYSQLDRVNCSTLTSSRDDTAWMKLEWEKATDTTSQPTEANNKLKPYFHFSVGDIPVLRIKQGLTKILSLQAK